MPGRVSDRRHLPHRVRHGRHSGRRLQRLRLLHRRLSLRRDRTARAGLRGRTLRLWRPRRRRAKVHPLLRPPEGRAGARVRQGLSHRLDSVRPSGRADREGARPLRAGVGRGLRRRAAVRRRPQRRCGRLRGFLPPARRSRGLRAPAGSSSPDAPPATDLGSSSGGRGCAGGRRCLRVRRTRNLLARGALLTALVGIGVSPVLLIKDLGRPERFYNMLRVFKVTSPMSVGTWLVAATGGATGVAAGCELFGGMPGLRTAAERVAGGLGLPVTTYTAALLADTAVPIWHEARQELPLVFAGGAAAAAGGAATMVTPAPGARPPRRLGLFGAALELGATRTMEERLGFLAEPYETGEASTLAKAAKGLTAAGAAGAAPWGGGPPGAGPGGGGRL